MKTDVQTFYIQLFTWKCELSKILSPILYNINVEKIAFGNKEHITD